MGAGWFYLVTEITAAGTSENTGGGGWMYTTADVSWSSDPLLALCWRETPRLFGRARICGHTLEQHMERDYGHTFVAEQEAWQ